MNRVIVQVLYLADVVKSHIMMSISKTKRLIKICLINSTKKGFSKPRCQCWQVYWQVRATHAQWGRRKQTVQSPVRDESAPSWHFRSGRHTAVDTRLTSHTTRDRFDLQRKRCRWMSIRAAQQFTVVKAVHCLYMYIHSTCHFSIIYVMYSKSV